MKFQYIGDPKDPNEPLETKEAFGMTFEPGEAVEVTDEAVIAKLQGNSHFAEEGKEPARKKPGRPRKSSLDD